VLGVLLGVPVLGAIGKGIYGVVLLFTPGAHLWGGDFFTFFSPSAFVGTGAAWWARWRSWRSPCSACRGWSAAASVCPRRGPGGLHRVRRPATVVDRGNYTDFKHLSFVGAFVVAFAAAGLVWLVLSRRRELIVAGVALAALWLVPAIHRVRQEAGLTLQQVNVDLVQLRDWSSRLPPGRRSGSTSRPPHAVVGGYMLYKHPLDAPYPVLNTTYAHVPWG